MSCGLAEGGRLRRLYTYADGQTYSNIGAPLPDELDQGLRFAHEFDEDDQLTDEDWDKRPDEETVLTLSGLWSLNPLTIEDRFTEPSLGWTGEQ